MSNNDVLAVAVLAIIALAIHPLWALGALLLIRGGRICVQIGRDDS